MGSRETAARVTHVRLLGAELAVLSVLAPVRRVEALTPSEREVLALLCELGELPLVAARRRRSIRTIRRQVESIYRKLGVGSRSELAVAVGGRQFDPDRVRIRNT